MRGRADHAAGHSQPTTLTDKGKEVQGNSVTLGTFHQGKILCVQWLTIVAAGTQNNTIDSAAGPGDKSNGVCDIRKSTSFHTSHAPLLTTPQCLRLSRLPTS